MPQMTLGKRREQAREIFKLVLDGNNAQQIVTLAHCSKTTVTRVLNSRERCYICQAPSEQFRHTCKKHLLQDVFINGEFPPIPLGIKCPSCRQTLLFDGEFTVKCPDGHLQDQTLSQKIRNQIEKCLT